MVKLMQRGVPGAMATMSAGRQPASGDAMVAVELDGRCDECGSAYATHASAAGVCRECAHHLYGVAACRHDMTAGRCRRCGWDGSVSHYLASIKQMSPAS